MTVEKFVDKLEALDEIEDKYAYANAYMRFMIKHMQFSVLHYAEIKKEIDKRSLDVSQ